MKKLSELMREGAKLHPQCEGDFAIFDDTGNVIATCAIGCMALATDPLVDLKNDDGVYGAIEQASGIKLLDVRHRDGTVNLPLAQHIWRKNDIRHMTREQIAEWLENNGL
jgi:hypothetical protein